MVGLCHGEYTESFLVSVDAPKQGTKEKKQPCLGTHFDAASAKFLVQYKLHCDAALGPWLCSTSILSVSQLLLSQMRQKPTSAK